MAELGAIPRPTPSQGHPSIHECLREQKFPKAGTIGNLIKCIVVLKGQLQVKVNPGTQLVELNLDPYAFIVIKRRLIREVGEE